ncbi:MAG: anaerobic ribonucleoside-triphosphate reductase [Candidatus Bathyarchaeota archaeon]|nr:anaerobic ribonucleoside-triphosphate reductase [Candidatus Bathyarchaeota archaeon]
MVSVSHKLRGVRILKAVSSPTRLQILSLLFDKSALSYSELMSLLRMSPSKDAGRFAYHLRFLLKADLVEVDADSKKYCLTDLGKMVVDVADRIEKRAYKPRGMLIRTSRSTLEEFDVNRIADSLIRETRMPADLAQKVAKEAEKQILKSRTKYVTAPLIREIVNTILIDKGLEDYRHRLTRLGLPVHDVFALIEGKSKTFEGAESIRDAAGDTVLREYILLNVLPRDIADAHLSGSLHLDRLDSWITKPTEVVHDIRFFLQNGLHLEKTASFGFSPLPPRNFEEALAIVLNVILHSVREVNSTQTLEYFNVFLSPFIRAPDSAKIEESLRFFLFSVCQHADVSFGLELVVPEFLASKPAVGFAEKARYQYRDFLAEAQLLASVLFKVVKEQSVLTPLRKVKLTVKVRSDIFVDEKARQLFLEAHSLALGYGNVFFADVSEKDNACRVFSPSGCWYNDDLNGDWETDTLRVGCLGHVTVNLPRIVYEAEKDKAKFFSVLKERLNMASRALEIKYRALRNFGKGLLPFLLQRANGDEYFRLDASSLLVSFAGFENAAEAFSDSKFEEEKSAAFEKEVVDEVTAFLQKSGKRVRRLSPVVLPDFEASRRLVQADIERYGVGKIRFSGTRDKPFYPTFARLTYREGKLEPKPLSNARRSSWLHEGANLTVVELGEAEIKPDSLILLSKQLMSEYGIRFFTYNRKLTFCSSCGRSSFGQLHKCPLCGATSALTLFDRFALE